MTLLQELKTSLFKLIKKTCPNKKICQFYHNELNHQVDGIEEKKRYFCENKYKECARYFLANVHMCDCVDSALEPQEIEKAKLVLHITRKFKPTLTKKSN